MKTPRSVASDCNKSNRVVLSQGTNGYVFLGILPQNRSTCIPILCCSVVGSHSLAFGHSIFAFHLKLLSFFVVFLKASFLICIFFLKFNEPQTYSSIQWGLLTRYVLLLKYRVISQSTSQTNHIILQYFKVDFTSFKFGQNPISSHSLWNLLYSS